MKDNVGDWFKAYEDVGYPSKIGFAKGELGNKNVQWKDLPHCKYDGISGLSHLLLNHEKFEINIPASKFKPPKWFEWPGILKQYLKNILRVRKIGKIPWNTQDHSIKGQCHENKILVLKQIQVSNLEIKAKSQKSSLNSYLLWSLNLAVRKVLLKDEANLVWVIPVNMRETSIRADQSGNRSSFSLLPIKTTEQPASVHKRLKQTLKAKGYFITWRILNLSRFLRHKTKVKIIKENLNRSYKGPIIGSFSNLGEWPESSKFSNNHNTFRAVSAFSTPERPLFSVCLTWNNNLSISLSVHPSVTGSVDKTQEVLDCWRELLEGPILQ